MITQDEFQFLSRGVEQRGRAILAFLHDYCTKGTRWNRIMPATRLHSMIARHHTVNLLRQIDPDRLAFPYGPDIIRDRAGRWRVVEDSAGVIGGLGDLPQSHRILYRLVPEFRTILGAAAGQVNDPLEYFGELARYFLEKAAQKNGIPLLYLRAFGDETDQETRRLSRVFARYGIESVTSSSRLRKIQIKEGKDAGIYLQVQGSRQRVGALLFHTSPEQLDGNKIRLNLEKLRGSGGGIYLRRFIRSLKRTPTSPSLKTALLQGHTWTNFLPGLQFINDKEFGLYVDKIIRGFLHETPLLESIPAKSAAHRTQSGGLRIDPNILKALRQDKNRYVVKKVNEDGGSGVWIGQKESKKSLEKIIDKLTHSPEEYIVQDFEHLSVVADRIVDLRLHAHVGTERILVSNTPWGRANWIQSDGKVNIGSRGFTSPVVVLGKSHHR